MSKAQTLKIALLGAGSVGSQVARLLLEMREEYAARAGVVLELAGIAVRNLDAQREVELPQELFTTDAADLVESADIVVEVMGGIEPARTLILQALAAGKDVVTANKALIAAHGSELHETAAKHGAQLTYEAAVAGAIPILRPLRDSLAGDRVQRVMGIVNGSTNYILDSMYRFNKTTEEAMKTASDLGYLEADPTLDVEGFDAASKATILARLAFHADVPESAVHRVGITGVSAEDVALAKENGEVIKLLAVTERVQGEKEESALAVRVQPVLLPETHPLAGVQGGKNAIFVQADAAGELFFAGAGAGGVETASAVLGDLIVTARRVAAGGAAVAPTTHAKLPVLSYSESTAAWQVRVRLNGKPVAKINMKFSAKGVVAKVSHDREKDELVLRTEQTPVANLQAAVQHLQNLVPEVEILSIIDVIEVSA